MVVSTFRTFPQFLRRMQTSTQLLGITVRWRAGRALFFFFFEAGAMPVAELHLEWYLCSNAAQLYECEEFCFRHSYIPIHSPRNLSLDVGPHRRCLSLGPRHRLSNRRSLGEGLVGSVLRPLRTSR